MIRYEKNKDGGAIMTNTKVELSGLRLRRPLVVLDTESTGTNATEDRIIELAMIKIGPSGTKVAQQVYRFNPERPIPPEATAVHGIRDEDVKNKPTFREKASEVLHFLEGCDLAGYNVWRFDLPLLEAEFRRAGIAINLRKRVVIDVQRIYHKKVPRDLSAALHYYCGEMHLAAHSALGDVEATLRVLQAQLKKYDDLPRDPEKLAEYCGTTKSDSWVDPKGKLLLINGEVVFNHGRYKNKKLSEVAQTDPDYLRFLLRDPADWKTEEYMQAIREALEKAGQQSDGAGGE